MRTATALLLLLALPCLASAQWYTDEEIKGLADLCNVSSSNPGSHALSANDCRDCAFNLASATSTFEQSGDAYACHGVCQNDDVINKHVAADGTVTDLSSTASDRAELCVGCLSRPGVTAYGCQHCLESNSLVADVTACMDCLESNPWAQETDPAKSYLINSYQWACGQCQSIRVDESTDPGAARKQCMDCIASPTAQAMYPGILTSDELASPGAITTDPTPTARDNDFGRCVYYANQTYLINTGSMEITGVYDACQAGLKTSTKLECMQCMFAADQGSPNTAGQNTAGYNLQASPSNNWACASYCQNPSYQPIISDTYASQSSKCEDCIQNPNVKDAWACGNCLQVSLVAGATTDMVAACFENIESDPYSGYASNYNWAVGKCASLTSSALRDVCFACINSQEAPDSSTTPPTLTDTFNKTTEANICGCIDLVQNQTLIDANLTRYHNQLDAIQKACFYEQVYYDDKGTLVEHDIPWGITPYTADDGSTAYPCLECIATATNNKAYGCTEYCQDPRLVTSTDQGDACSSCVQHPFVTDPSGCKLCMEAVPADAVNADAKRTDCFSCVESTFNGASNKAWGCSQCAQFANDALAASCYKCLEQSTMDPCSCVDMTKNGTIGGMFPACAADVPTKMRIWYVVPLGSTLTSFDWSFDSALPKDNPTHYVSGTITGANAISVTTIANSYDVYSVDIAFDGAALPANAPIWLTLQNGVSPPSNNVAWTYQQARTGQALRQEDFSSLIGTWFDLGDDSSFDVALKIFDSCGKTLVDTVQDVVSGTLAIGYASNIDDFAVSRDMVCHSGTKTLACLV